MKHFLFVSFILLFHMNLLAQSIDSSTFEGGTDFKEIPRELLEQLNTMGANESSLLNSYESAYFNIIFKKSRKEFDFIGKKIGFLRGDTGRIVSNKRKYFYKERYLFNSNYSTQGGILYIFNQVQKEKSGGYDAVIVESWTKNLMNADRAAKRLKRHKVK